MFIKLHSKWTPISFLLIASCRFRFIRGQEFNPERHIQRQGRQEACHGFREACNSGWAPASCKKAGHGESPDLLAMTFLSPSALDLTCWKSKVPKAPQHAEIPLDDWTIWKEEMLDPSLFQIPTENQNRLEWALIGAQHFGNSWRTMYDSLLKLHACFMEQRNRCRLWGTPYKTLLWSPCSVLADTAT